MAKVQSSTISYDQARSIVTSFGAKAREFANIILSIVGSNSSSFPKTTSFANNVLNLTNHAGQWQSNPGLLTTQSRNARQCYAEFRNSSNSHALNSAVQNLQRLLDETASAVDRMHNDREVLHNSENQNDGELEHYGRLGMRWGMHIFGKEKTYRTSMNKVGAADRKSIKKADRANIMSSRGDYKKMKAETAWTEGGTRRNARRAKRAYRKAYGAQRSSVRNRKRAERIVKAMNTEFANVTIDSISHDDISLGKKYSIEVIERSLGGASVNSYREEDD